MSIASINGIRHVKSLLRHYDAHATKVPLSFDLLRAVKQYGARYAQRMRAEESKSKWKATEVPASEQSTLEAETRDVEDEVAACKALLSSAEEIVNSGVKQEDMNKVDSGS